MPKTNMMIITITKAHMRQVKEFNSAKTMVRRLFSACTVRTTRTTRTKRKTRKMRRKERLDSPEKKGSTREFPTRSMSKMFHRLSSPTKKADLSAMIRRSSSTENQAVKQRSIQSHDDHRVSFGTPISVKLFFTLWSAWAPMYTVFAAMAKTQRLLKSMLWTICCMIGIPSFFLCDKSIVAMTSSMVLIGLISSSSMSSLASIPSRAIDSDSLSPRLVNSLCNFNGIFSISSSLLLSFFVPCAAPFKGEVADGNGVGELSDTFGWLSSTQCSSTAPGKEVSKLALSSTRYGKL
mmetsp:Transcript_45249/g.125553  ORF Transcript_45249/g.125553 Transcript_45249/m.125553 type:complete len:293 (-) Transcript_45249:71-949(-)